MHKTTCSCCYCWCAGQPRDDPRNLSNINMMMERNETVPLAIFPFESENFYYSMHWQKGGKERQDIHNGLQVHFFRSLGSEFVLRGLWKSHSFIPEKDIRTCINWKELEFLAYLFASRSFGLCNSLNLPKYVCIKLLPVYQKVRHYKVSTLMTGQWLSGSLYSWQFYQSLWTWFLKNWSNVLETVLL